MYRSWYDLCILPSTLNALVSHGFCNLRQQITKVHIPGGRGGGGEREREEEEEEEGKRRKKEKGRWEIGHKGSYMLENAIMMVVGWMKPTRIR